MRLHVMGYTYLHYSGKGHSVVKRIRSYMTSTETLSFLFDLPNYDEYIVSAGETLWSIANDYYHDSDFWNIIAFYNVISPIDLQPGMIIKLPRT